MVETLDKQYADVLAPLKDTMNPKKFGLKYVQKLAKRNSVSPYTVPDEVTLLSWRWFDEFLKFHLLCPDPVFLSAGNFIEYHEKVA